MINKYLQVFGLMLLLASCAPSRYINQSARKEILDNKLFAAAHTGISIYNAEDNKYLYNYQGDKYFVPASNTKIFSLYAGLKYLGDSLAGIRYRETADSLVIYPTGDPTLLHEQFSRQPVIDLLKRTAKTIAIDTSRWQEQAFGRGWAWDDYSSDYMAERSALPVYGNVIKWIQSSKSGDYFGYSAGKFIISEPDVNWPVRFIQDTSVKAFDVRRDKTTNLFYIHEGTEKYSEIYIPFLTNGLRSAIELLKDTTGKRILPVASPAGNNTLKTLYSQPSDSLFQPMMYNSDNFFAEQTLLMASEHVTGIMNMRRIIDSLLAGDLSQLPQKPVWVDGSGLSRYNLFTPQDFVWILNKMKNDFGLLRMQQLFATGGKGTLKSYYLENKDIIFAKTGTLSGQLALSGFMTTRKNKLLFFSVLINNHRSNTNDLRRAVEKFITGIRNRL